MIEDIVRDVEVGGIYYGEVTKIMPFGAFVDLGCGGKEGLVHISKISNERIKNVEDVLSYRTKSNSKSNRHRRPRQNKPNNERPKELNKLNKYSLMLCKK